MNSINVNLNNKKECERRIPPKYHIRNMSVEDVQQVLRIWSENNLQEGTHTIESFMKVDSEGFIVAVDDETGQILGMCAGVFVNSENGFIGLYGVSRSYQKLGIGISMWKQIMAHIGERNAGLYSVPEQLTNYRDKCGFIHKDSKSMLIYDSDTVQTFNLVKSIRGVRLQKIDDSILPDVINYDQLIHRYSRAKLLPHVFAEEDTVSFAAIDEYDNKIVGFGCFRTNNDGRAMAGPLYADNDAVAENIIYEIIKAFPIVESKGLLYMTLDSNPGGMRIADKLGLDLHEELPRYFRKHVYENGDWNRVYCIHSPNFALF